LQLENNQLQTDLNDTVDDLIRIRDEHDRENKKNDLQLNQLRQEIDDKQAIINGTLENNVSLAFELSTYRNLLNSEEKRLNRIEQEPISSSSNQTQQVKDYSIQKLAVKKTARGSLPTIFDTW
jgi:chromosome segregation ATPase